VLGKTRQSVHARFRGERGKRTDAAEPLTRFEVQQLSTKLFEQYLVGEISSEEWGRRYEALWSQVA
jgi:hypothetical protein